MKYELAPYSKKIISPRVTLAVLAVIFLFFNPWLAATFNQNKFLALVYLAAVVTLVFAYLNDSKFVKTLFILLFCTLVFFQFKTTDYANEYKLTPHEANLQIARMNSYPPSLARVAYVLEVKKETQLLYALQANFFSTIDLNLYFLSYFALVSAPLGIVGLYFVLGSGKKFVLRTLAIAVIILTFLGVNGTYGPFLLFPFIVLAIVVCLTKLLEKMRWYEN